MANSFIALVKMFTITGLALLSANPVSAQEYTNYRDAAADFKNWKSFDTAKGFEAYAEENEYAFVISFRGGDKSKRASNDDGFKKIMSFAEKICPGMIEVELESVDESTSRMQHISKAHRCDILVGKNNKGELAYVFTAEKMPADLRRDRMGLYIYSKMQGILGEGDIKLLENRDSINGSATNGTGVSNTQPQTLKEAIDRIPADRRPIGVIYTEGAWDSSNAMATWTPHILFPNGIAISPKCRRWNPLGPIVGEEAMGCGIYKYRLEGRTAYLDGKSESLDDYQGFKKGEMLSINFDRVGGLSPMMSTPGVNSTWGSELTMTSQGKINVGNWSGATVTGTGYTAYGGSQSRGIEGDYYVDGFLIAVKDKRGKISVSFIWQQDGDHIFLNDEQYNR
jgi:hypothetical protein